MFFDDEATQTPVDGGAATSTETTATPTEAPAAPQQ